MTLLHNALAGGLTGLVSTLASCPIELVKCRTQGMLEIVSKPTSGTAAAANAAVRFRYEINIRFHASSGVVRIWCEEGDKTKRKYSSRVTHKIIIKFMQ